MGLISKKADLNRAARMLLRANCISGIVAAIAVGLVASGQAHAQNAPEVAQGVTGSDDNNADIVVTAQFKSQRIQEIPLSISAVSGNQIESRGLQNISDIAHTMPNVLLEKSGAGVGVSASVYIRGVGQSDASFALEPGVGVYVDDVYYGVISGSLFDTLDLDRVEVLRGPQGTLAGKNSIGGAIKLYSRKPDSDPHAYIEAGYGSFDRVNLRGATNVTVVPDRLYVRLSASAKRADGYLNRLDYVCVKRTSTSAPLPNGGGKCKIGTDGGQKLFTGRVAARLIIADGVENTITGDIIQDDSDVPATKLTKQNSSWAGTNNYLTGPKSYTSYSTYISDPGGSNEFAMRPEAPLHGWGIANNFSADLGGDITLASITGYRVSKTYFAVDGDASPADVFSQEWVLDHKQFTQELRLSGKMFDKLLEWTVGGFYYDAKGRSIARFNVRGGYNPGGGGIDFLARTDDTINTTSKSAFGQLILHPTSQLSVVGALRYTKDHKDYLFHRYNNDGSVQGSLDGLFGVFNGNRLDYRVAIDYKVTPDILLYAQTATGFKGGGVNSYPYFKEQVVPFKPEILTSYEGGFKASLMDRSVQLNGAVFHNIYKGLQGLLRTCPSITPGGAAGPCSAQSNIGDARVNGAELETQIHAGNLSINGSIGYLDFKYTNILPDVGVSLDSTNIYTPKWTASAGIEYALPLGDVGQLTPRFDVSYVGSTYVDAANSPGSRLSSRTIANAQLKWKNEDGDWEATLAVTNVFNTFKYISLLFDNTPIYFAQTGQPIHPREFLLTLKRRF